MAAKPTVKTRDTVRKRRQRSLARQDKERKAVEIGTEIAIELHKPALKELEKH